MRVKFDTLITRKKMNRLAELEKLIDQEPNDPFLHYAYIIEYVKRNPAELEPRLNNLILKFPEYLPAHEKLVRHYYQNQMEEMALERAGKALQLANDQGATKAAAEIQALVDEMQFEG